VEIFSWGLPVTLSQPDSLTAVMAAGVALRAGMRKVLEIFSAWMAMSCIEFEILI
jgi:hydrogenase/urease accessory protein HupE